MPHPLGKIVAPIYRLSGDRPAHEGSSVLVRFSSSYCVLTAAHTLAVRSRSKLFLQGLRRSIFLEGPALASCELRPEIAGQAGHSDWACHPISKSAADSLSVAGFSFLPIGRDTASAEPAIDSKAKIEAYMGRSVVIDHSNQTIDLEPLQYDGTFYSDSKIAKKGFNPAECVGVRIVQCYHQGARIPTPTRAEMKGISGGAIWSKQADSVRLVGIVNEFHPASGLLLGVKLGAIVRAMAARLESESTT